MVATVISILFFLAICGVIWYQLGKADEIKKQIEFSTYAVKYSWLPFEEIGTSIPKVQEGLEPLFDKNEVYIVYLKSINGLETWFRDKGMKGIHYRVYHEQDVDQEYWEVLGDFTCGIGRC